MVTTRKRATKEDWKSLGYVSETLGISRYMLNKIIAYYHLEVRDDEWQMHRKLVNMVAVRKVLEKGLPQ